MNGEVLKQLRNIYGYNVAEMSKKLKITPNYLYEIERSQKKPSQSLIEKYAELFDLKPSSIMLLSEAYEDDTDKPAGSSFIRRLMISAIQSEIKRLEKQPISNLPR